MIKYFFYFFLSQNVAGAIFLNTSLEKIKAATNKVISVVGNSVFNPKDFTPQTLKNFVKLSTGEKFSKIGSNKFKTVFYPWLVFSNLHNITMYLDFCLLRLTNSSEKNNKQKLPSYAYGFLFLGKKIFYDFGFKTNHNSFFMFDQNNFLQPQTFQEATYSKQQYQITPTIQFFYNIYKNIYLMIYKNRMPRKKFKKTIQQS